MNIAQKKKKKKIMQQFHDLNRWVSLLKKN